MKNIGIIGGLSPESTILYYKTIINEYRRKFKNENYPNIIIYSVNFGYFTQLIEENRLEEAANLLIEAGKSLEKAGANFIIISANTPHMLLNYITPKINIPIISIIDSLAEELKKDKVKKVGLLGTKFTLTKQFYTKGLEKHNIKTIIPEPNDINIVNKIIYEELVKGIIREESKNKLIKIINKLIEMGAEGIALACTELPLLIKGKINNIKLYDTAKIHAIKALEYATK
ncbi:MAG: aspartate/glutamate racemase [Candidatus Methanomethylicota archaeon]|uniref:Aspartate/glutamate racemase n=1 Tax=Thermoproteota archaeon TaxID=2056631 RepID=A0A497ESZ9_9CREN|nr:MAG: aspartate/glutamate racemase [Candidatus Verstraetearchaeota archaeon]